MDETKRLWRVFRKNATAVIGLISVIIIILISMLTPSISPHNPMEQNLLSRLTPPGSDYLLGADEYGRDQLSRILYGSRISLNIAFFSVLLGLLIGTWWGMAAGFFGGKAEIVLMRGVDVLMTFPTLLLGLIVMTVLGQGIINLIFALGLVMAPRFARLSYSSTIAIITHDYISAARAIGQSNFRILLKHVMPNIFGNLLVMATMWLATIIRIEASLSFLGLGVAPPTPTWGGMVKLGVDYLNLPWLAFYPGLAIMITCLAFNMLGDGLRDISDPKLCD